MEVYLRKIVGFGVGLDGVFIRFFIGIIEYCGLESCFDLIVFRFEFKFLVSS